MKTLISAIVCLLAFTTAKGQLANTKWSGMLGIPSPTEVVLDFKKDTVDVKLKETGAVVESSLYSVKDNTITMTKVSGLSPCDGGSVAIMSFSIKDNQLRLKVVNDNCDPRAQAWLGEPFKKE